MMRFILTSLMALFLGRGEAVSKTEEAVLAMGCFWCGETAFKNPKTYAHLPGIIDVRVGYAGGTIPNPTYEHHPGYVEAVKVVFDTDQISYDNLLDIFWNNIDPFDEAGQFCDKGEPYKAVIFTDGEAQQTLAEASKDAVEKKLRRDVVTEIRPLTTYIDAEDYHQDYAEKNPLRYSYYRWACGRDDRLKTVWGESAAKHDAS